MADGRFLEYRILREEDGMTVQDYLKNRLRFSARQISRLKFREDGIRVNGAFARVTLRLREGDQLRIGLKDKRRTGKINTGNGGWLSTEETRRLLREKGIDFTFPPLRILYEDEDILALYKASGLVCHPSPGHYADTLANQAAEYLSGKMEDPQEAPRIHVMGRLDKDTSGIVIFALNQDAAAELFRQREEGNFFKTYLALTKGCPEPCEGSIRFGIRKMEGVLMKMETAAQEEGGKPAETFYRVLAGNEKAGLVQCRIRHGRTHQIRVHLSAAGYPLWYDDMYGEGIDGKHFYLHAGRVELLKPFSHEKLVIRAELPDDFCAELESFGIPKPES